MNNNDTWTARFQSYRKALARLQEGVDMDINALSDIERDGLVQRFEFTFELAWKTLQDYCQWNSFDVYGPKNSIRKAYELGIIKDGHTWMQMAKDRNLTVHTYDETRAIDIIQKIHNSYFQLLTDLFSQLSNLIENEQE